MRNQNIREETREKKKKTRNRKRDRLQIGVGRAWPGLAGPRGLGSRDQAARYLGIGVGRTRPGLAGPSGLGSRVRAAWARATQLVLFLWSKSFSASKFWYESLGLILKFVFGHFGSSMRLHIFLKKFGLEIESLRLDFQVGSTWKKIHIRHDQSMKIESQKLDL